MKKGRIATNGHRRLIHPKLLQFSKPACNTCPRPHGVNGFNGLKTAGPAIHCVAANIAADKTVLVVQTQRHIDRPIGCPVRTTGAVCRISGRHHGGLSRPGFFLIFRRQGFVLKAQNLLKGSDHQIGIQFTDRWHQAISFAVDCLWSDGFRQLER